MQLLDRKPPPKPWELEIKNLEESLKVKTKKLNLHKETYKYN